METFLYIVFFLSCLTLIGTVLLQPGKTDAGALFTSGVSSASLNPRGTASILSKLTIAAATVFMLTALLLSLPALTGNVSVLQTQGETKSATSDTNTNVDANANTSNANTNAEVNSTNSNTTNTEVKPEEKKAEEQKTEEKSETKAEENKNTEEKK